MLDTALRVLSIEAKAIEQAAQRLDDTFTLAIRILQACRGRVIVTGMGKSGHIGNKIAATLASTGTPAFFVHPGEASHGDLGMIQRQDCVLALSNSGETQELLTILPLLKRYGIKMIAMTGNPQSTMALLSDAHIHAGVDIEACPLNLAPTASTTTALALGDALAICLLEAREFSADDFARSHPGGALGRRLLLRVSDIMQTNAIPTVTPDAPLGEALVTMSRGGVGVAIVIDDKQRAIGIFTDGDLRRTLDKGLPLAHTSIADCMTPNPSTIAPEALAAAALHTMDTQCINALIVVDPQRLVLGVLSMHDLLRAGVT